MKKIFVLIIAMILIASFLLSGCVDNKIYHWEFEKDYTEVAQIMIVDATGPRNYTEIKSLDIGLVQNLMSDIENLEMNKYGWNLHNTHGKCFVIKFKNGDYDIIGRQEPMHCKYDEEGKIHAIISWLVCDADKFDELINKYMEIE